MRDPVLTMTTSPRQKTYSYEVYALLWVSRKYEALIRDLLADTCNIPPNTQDWDPPADRARECSPTRGAALRHHRD